MYCKRANAQQPYTPAVTLYQANLSGPSDNDSQDAHNKHKENTLGGLGDMFGSTPGGEDSRTAEADAKHTAATCGGKGDATPGEGDTNLGAPSIQIGSPHMSPPDAPQYEENTYQTNADNVVDVYDRSTSTFNYEWSHVHENIALFDIIKHLYDEAKRQAGHNIDELTFVIKNGSDLWDALKIYSQQYSRAIRLPFTNIQLSAGSSHFTQKANAHWGIDIPELKAIIQDKTHLVFADVSAKKDRSLLYLKPENFGTNTLSDQIAHSTEFIESLHRKLFSPQGNDRAAYRKEHIPQDIKTMLTDLINNIEQTIAGKKAMLQSLHQDGICSAYNKYLRNINITIQSIPSNRQHIRQEILKKLNDCLNILHQRYDPSTLDIRYGNEIIIDMDKLPDLKRLLQGKLEKIDRSWTLVNSASAGPRSELEEDGVLV